MASIQGDAGGGVRYSVDLEQLRATATAVAAAARAARDVSDHPAVVRGRAQDGGDDELRDAAAALAHAWSWTLEEVGQEMSQAAALLQIVVDQYDETERQAAGWFAGRTPR